MLRRLAALNEILDALASSRINPKRAGTLLYGLQLAAENLNGRPLFSPAFAPPLAHPRGSGQLTSPN
jgi:hypothetical protein